MKLRSRSSVICLFEWGSPFAILWCVIAVIVYTFDRVFAWWFWPHIFIELSKVVNPLRAYLNTPTSPPYISGTIWVQTSLSHLAPATIFWRFTKPMLPTYFWPAVSPIFEIVIPTPPFWRMLTVASFNWTQFWCIISHIEYPIMYHILIQL